MGLGLTVGLLGGLVRADEVNEWPGEVRQVGPGGDVKSWSAAGPFLFDYMYRPGAPVPSAAQRHADGEQPADAGDVISGFRPFYVQRKMPDGTLAEFSVLYPIFDYRSYGEYYLWTVFDLVNRYGRKEAAPPGPNPEATTLDVWPLYFSRDSGAPGTSYQGLLPFAGRVQGHLWFDQIDWVLFPLWAKTRRSGVISTYTPFPFVRVISGAEHGFALWPLFGSEERPGVFTRKFILWPFTWDDTIQPTEEMPPGTAPKREVGFLPFYTGERGPNGVNKSYFWPFFGYSDLVAPVRYHETRYFWPFLVQGRGDGIYVNRTGPFYTHSIRKGLDKTWVLWPFWRRLSLTEEGVAQTKTQLLYFLYWDLEERSTRNPNAAPARKTFVWPLFSVWDNGAGRRQIQAISPFDVFFPENENIRESWSPIAAVMRRDESPGSARTSLFWDAVTWERHDAEATADFHLGPLLSVERRPGSQRVALGNGLMGFKRTAGTGWHLFLMEFSGNRSSVSAVAK